MRIHIANAWVQLTNLPTPRGWTAELAMLADILLMVSPWGGHQSTALHGAGQEKFTGHRPDVLTTVLRHQVTAGLKNGWADDDLSWLYGWSSIFINLLHVQSACYTFPSRLCRTVQGRTSRWYSAAVLVSEIKSFISTEGNDCPLWTTFLVYCANLEAFCRIAIFYWNVTTPTVADMTLPSRLYITDPA